MNPHELELVRLTEKARKLLDEIRANKETPIPALSEDKINAMLANYEGGKTRRHSKNRNHMKKSMNKKKHTCKKKHTNKKRATHRRRH